MYKNNKSASVASVLIVIVIIGILLYYFIPRDLFSKKKASGFANFKSGKNQRAQSTPSSLNWKKSFAYEKKGNNNGQSYMKFMIDKKNEKK